MICQKCFRNPVSIKITLIIEGERQDIALCQECAKELGMPKEFSGLTDDIAGIIFGYIQAQREQDDTLPETACPDCGLKIKDFKENGLLGCPQCYDVFDEYLKTLLRRYHGSNRHYPSRKKVNPLIELEKKLKLALKQEDYEKAATLRDKIQALKSAKNSE